MLITSLQRALFLSALLSLATPTFGQESMNGQASINKPAFMVSELNLRDEEAIKPYRDQVEETLKPYGGRFVVRGGVVDVKEGAPSGRIVIIRFDTLAQAKAWYDSAAYQAILPFRKNSGVSRVYFVEGLPGQ